MPILDLQMRQRELGRIRMGRKAEGKGNPQKLDKFRFTSPSRDLIEQIAELYGGTCEPWINDGQSQFEVFTAVNRVPILVPPQPISQWYEMWSGGGCQRRCDGQRNILAGDAKCACPLDPIERRDLAVRGKACKPTTRLNVVLADVTGIGVWRLESKGFHAATKLPMTAEFLAQATEAGTYLPAELALVPNFSKRPGEGRRDWMEPVIDVRATPRALMAGDLSAVGGSSKAAIGGSRRALEAGRPDYVKLAEAAPDLDAWRAVWNQAFAAGDLDDRLKGLLAPIGQKLRNAAAETSTAPGPAPDENGVVDAEVVEDSEELDRLWGLILENADGMDYKQLEREFAARTNGLHPQSANAEQLRAFLVHLQNTVAAGVAR